MHVVKIQKPRLAKTYFEQPGPAFNISWPVPGSEIVANEREQRGEAEKTTAPPFSPDPTRLIFAVGPFVIFAVPTISESGTG